MAIHTIKAKKYSDVIEEYDADAAITPGMLVELTSTGVKKHATAGGNALPMFALEDELQGNGIDDDYATDDKVQVWIPNRGDIVNALLKDEQNISVGDFLESDGEGKLQKWEGDAGDSTTVTQLNSIVGQAIEAVDLSTLPEGSESSAGGTYHNPRIQVRII